MNALIDCILGRQSIRQFTGEPIPTEDLETIAKAGMAAPSAVNVQPWAFLMLTDREKMNQLCAQLPYAKMLDKAAAAIIVCGVPHKDEFIAPRFWMVDCSAASQNILLATHALGYGAVWTAVWPDESRLTAVRAICGIPDSIIPFNVIPVGIPVKNDTPPKNKFKTENLHWNSW